MFFFLLLVPTTLAHAYLWKRLVKDTTSAGRARRAGTAAVVLLFGMLLAAVMLPGWIGARRAAVVAWPGFLWLGLVMYLTLTLAVLEIPRFVLGRRARGTVAAVAAERDLVPAGARPERPPEPPAPEEPATGTTRRVFLARSFAATSGLVAAGVVGYGATQALGPPPVKHVPIALTKLDPTLAGFRIAVVADMHLGPLLGRGHTERIVEIVNGLRPDLVAIVGDLVDGTVAELGEAVAPLRDLASANGSFFVTGNHEYFSGAQPWLAELSRLGVHPLRNERLTVQRGTAAFDLAGINDVTGRRYREGPDIATALRGRDPARPVVLLAHQPVQVAEAAQHGVDLQLSGHTHGGQVYPFHYVVAAQQPVLSGLVRVGGTWLYVTRGVGFWGPPVRVGAPPDVTLVELRPT